MEVQLTNQEAEEHFLNALCNGSQELAYYGISLDYTDEAREKALKVLDSPCREDVWMQMLKQGDVLIFNDEESEEEHEVTIAMVHERVAKTPIRHLMDAINENDDAITADCILQTVIFGEVIYG